MTADERAELARMLAERRPGVAFFRGLGGFLNLAFLFAACYLAAAVGLAAVHVARGPRSAMAPWIALAGTLVCVLFASVSNARRRTPQPELQSDLEGGVVSEERLTFTAARVFQELEHGGLFYFLRTTDDRVFVVFDHESQDLGVAGKDPLASTFHPQAELLLVTAPASKRVLHRTFSGARLDVAAPRELALPPQQWPEDEEFCAIPWSKLE